MHMPVPTQITTEYNGFVNCYIVYILQLTYSMTRFAIYESVKNNMIEPGQPFPFYQKVLLGGVAGCAGGFVGTPADLINVR